MQTSKQATLPRQQRRDTLDKQAGSSSALTMDIESELRHVDKCPSQSQIHQQQSHSKQDDRKGGKRQRDSSSSDIESNSDGQCCASDDEHLPPKTKRKRTDDISQCITESRKPGDSSSTAQRCAAQTDADISRKRPDNLVGEITMGRIADDTQSSSVLSRQQQLPRKEQTVIDSDVDSECDEHDAIDDINESDDDDSESAYFDRQAKTMEDVRKLMEFDTKTIARVCAPPAAAEFEALTDYVIPVIRDVLECGDNLAATRYWFTFESGRDCLRVNKDKVFLPRRCNPRSVTVFLHREQGKTISDCGVDATEFVPTAWDSALDADTREKLHSTLINAYDPHTKDVCVSAAGNPGTAMSGSLCSAVMDVIEVLAGAWLNPYIRCGKIFSWVDVVITSLESRGIPFCGKKKYEYSEDEDDECEDDSDKVNMAYASGGPASFGTDPAAMVCSGDALKRYRSAKFRSAIKSIITLRTFHVYFKYFVTLVTRTVIVPVTDESPVVLSQCAIARKRDAGTGSGINSSDTASDDTGNSSDSSDRRIESIVISESTSTHREEHPAATAVDDRSRSSDARQVQCQQSKGTTRRSEAMVGFWFVCATPEELSKMNM